MSVVTFSTERGRFLAEVTIKNSGMFYRVSELTSDMYASAVVKAATSEGIRIPDDLALIGFDNTYISQMSHPSVAAVSLPRFQLGYMACEVLAERIMNPASEEPKHFLLETELVLRDSV